MDTARIKSVLRKYNDLIKWVDLLVDALGDASWPGAPRQGIFDTTVEVNELRLRVFGKTFYADDVSLRIPWEVVEAFDSGLSLEAFAMMAREKMLEKCRVASEAARTEEAEILFEKEFKEWKRLEVKFGSGGNSQKGGQ